MSEGEFEAANSRCKRVKTRGGGGAGDDERLAGWLAGWRGSNEEEGEEEGGKERGWNGAEGGTVS